MPRSEAAAHRGLPAAPDPGDPVAEQAIAWAVQLQSGTATAADRDAFAAWQRADPRHAAAAAHMARALGRLDALPGGAGTRQALHRSLLAAPPGRRAVLRHTLALAAVGGTGGLLWLQAQRPLGGLVADFSTTTGERRVVALADGSRLWLNARSAVDQHFDAGIRRLRLRTGELIVEVSPDGAGRAFVVQTPEGEARALGTRFLVRREATDSLVAVLHSAVRVSAGAGAPLTLHAGQSARLTAGGVQPDTLAPQAASAWEDGFVEVHDRPLREVVAALQPYRPGALRISDAAGALRVTGSFPLDDSDRSLAALAQALPITVHRRTPWWIAIDLR
ncbi:FecR family protein [Pseudacidovorax intermedius]|uniref:FecR family protein n=1 Tax=Pseudacidovorax intermedius TaxID=433924 RepID=UPI0007344A9A|nr:FecR domain-containing protein [Pseudacidovorax intermedius]